MEDIVFESVRTVTQEEFARLVEERARTGDLHEYELLNGRIVMTPPAGFPHGALEVAVCAVLLRFVQERGLGLVFGPSQGFTLPSGDTLSPDAAFVSNERWRAGPAPADGEFIRIVPDLVVEILSPSTASRDRGEKRGIYERNGVREYWLVDARARTVTRFVLRANAYDAGRTFDDGASVESEILAGLSVPVSSLWLTAPART
ncbi:MAG TPA: Uma2 family endonuclease [Myxococcota bacterium]|jgi:Uma2 family endonuclease|nr:Uma2 family endonuclease [Myxococcota bacterium]